MFCVREIPCDGPEDRGLVMATCIFAIVINFVVQMGKRAGKISDSVFKFALLAFNLKSDCTKIEAGIQLFLFLFLAIHKSGMLSAEEYQSAYM